MRHIVARTLAAEYNLPRKCYPILGYGRKTIFQATGDQRQRQVPIETDICALHFVWLKNAKHFKAYYSLKLTLANGKALDLQIPIPYVVLEKITKKYEQLQRLLGRPHRRDYIPKVTEFAYPENELKVIEELKKIRTERGRRKALREQLKQQHLNTQSNIAIAGESNGSNAK